MEKLIGKTIKKIFVNDDFLVFETDRGNIIYKVEGDCCSRSYLHDFIGVKKLLENGLVKSVEGVELVEKVHTEKEKESNFEETKWYGYRIITQHPEFGEVDSAFSFRNESNGYYGGWISEDDKKLEEIEGLKEITDDWINS